MYITKRMLTIKPIKNASIRLYASASSSPLQTSSSKYCLDLVRQYDYENFLSTLLLKGNIRRSAMGIRAFNVEIAKISNQVSEDRIGIMRLKFWHDALEAIFGSKNRPIPDHPVIIELKLAVDEYNLQQLYFSRLIKARERSSKSRFQTSKELEQYAEETVSSVFHLLAKIVKSQNIDVDHAISHLGKAQGITNLLRAQQYFGRQKTINIPQQILIKHGISDERILRDNVDDKGVQDCVFDVASLANSHLEMARNLSTKVPNDVKPLLLPAVAVSRYLERLRTANFRLSDTSLNQRDSLLPFAYYWHLFTKKY